MTCQAGDSKDISGRLAQISTVSRGDTYTVHQDLNGVPEAIPEEEGGDRPEIE